MFLAKSILLKHYENGNEKKYPYYDPRSAKSRTYAGKSTKRGFSKEALALARIDFFGHLKTYTSGVELLLPSAKKSAQ